jgi:hypothetical protein
MGTAIVITPLFDMPLSIKYADIRLLLSMEYNLGGVPIISPAKNIFSGRTVSWTKR